MSRLTLTLTLLVACGTEPQRTPPASTGLTSSTGSPSTGTLTGSGTTTSGPELRVPSWNLVSEDSIWDDGVDVHHPTHARQLGGVNAVFFDAITAAGTRSVMVRTFGQLGPLDDAWELSPTEGELGRPDGAWLPGGLLPNGPAVVWHGEVDIYASRTNLDGQSLFSRRINTSVGVDIDRGQPDLALLADGQVMVVFHFSETGALPASRYYLQRLDELLEPVGTEAAIGESEQVGSPPDVEALPTGGFAIAWSTRTTTGGTIQLSVYDDTDALVSQLRVDEHTAGEAPSRPNIAVLDDGTLGVAWRLQDDSGSPLGAYGRIFAPDLTPRTATLELDPTGQRTEIAAGPDLFLFGWEPTTDQALVQAWDATHGLPLEDPWAPLQGTLKQKHLQSSLLEETPGVYTAMFTSDRGPTGSRTLGRSVWDLTLAAP